MFNNIDLQEKDNIKTLKRHVTKQTFKAKWKKQETNTKE